MDNRLVCLIYCMVFVTGIESLYICEFEFRGNNETKKCLWGCCGNTFVDACCDRNVPTPALTDTSGGVSNPHLGKIISGTIGGVLLFVTTCLLCIYVRTKRGMNRPSQGMHSGVPVGQPFTVYPQSSPPGTSVYPQGTTTGTTGSGVCGQTIYPTTTHGPSSNPMGTAHPSMEMQGNMMGQTQHGFSTEAKHKIEAPAPPPSNDPPPPYPGPESFDSKYDEPNIMKSGFY